MKFKRQLDTWAKKLKLFMDKIVTKVLKPYANLHAHMDDMDKRVNNRLGELSIPDLAKFTAKLK